MSTAHHVLNCSFAKWYPTFKSISFRSQVVTLPKGFVDYLVQDGVYLPDSSSALPKRSAPDSTATEDDYRDWSDSDFSDSDDPQTASHFPEVLAEVQQAIEVLGGTIIPKLNWSCPKDATWVTATNSIKCTNADEVLLLLKSSDRVAHDICNAFDSCEGQPQQDVPYTLVLKKYYDLKPEREFRCFVQGHDLIGVSQRDVTQHFPALADEASDLEEIILEFFEEHVQHKFPDPDYTMDVYVATNRTVRLMDFNPIGGSTAPLLFDWDELGYGGSKANAAHEQDANAQNGHAQMSASATVISGGASAASAMPLDFRVLTEAIAMRPNKGAYGVPFDLVDTSQGSALSEMLEQLQEADTALTAMNIMNHSVEARR
ncbi:MAG: cell division cycle protein [Trebouxia sp. A1-2]|nr:MAG: cell division cycle protein [Trebouxia sp. A1-2]